MQQHVVGYHARCDNGKGLSCYGLIAINIYGGSYYPDSEGSVVIDQRELQCCSQQQQLLSERTVMTFQQFREWTVPI